jgi:isoquinoline 1-oxidoreductase
VAWEVDNWNSGNAGIRTPYDVPNQRIAFHPSDSPLRQGSYRGLAATATALNRWVVAHRELVRRHHTP